LTASRQKSAETGCIATLGIPGHLRPAGNQAGHFARDWRKLRDRVRQMIDQDPRFQAIRGQRAACAPQGNAAATSFATKDGTE